MSITKSSVSKIFTFSTEPNTAVENRFWFDSTNKILKRYNGTSWEPINIDSDNVIAKYPTSQPTTLTEYLSTLVEAIGDKQDKLLYYSETSGDTPSATISVANIKLEGSVAEGSNTTASGNGSHAEGISTIASNLSSHAEGYHTAASGSYSHAEGYLTTTSGLCSHAEGHITKASSDYQHAQGKYNIEDANDKYADIIGNGSSSSERSNAATVSWNGISWSQTDVRAGGTDQDSATYSLAALSEDISNKQNQLVFYHEDTSTNQEASIQSANSFLIKNTTKGLILDGNNGGITIKNGMFNSGQAVISLEVNNWKDNSDAILFSVDGAVIKISDAFLIPEIKNKQNSTDTALNTTDKTIVGAINEINSIFNVNALPTPITDVKTITTTLENLITDTQYANKPGTILINPAITNTGAILVGENITDLNKAFPIYTDQPVTIAFKNINDFKVAGNVAGDKFNYIVSFGYINTNTVSDNLKITTTNGVYEITPEGDSESMTLKLSKIS